MAARLGNTPTICRKCYIHPEVIQAYIEGQLTLDVGEAGDDAALKPEEAAVLALLQARLKATVRDQLAASLAAVKRAAPASPPGP